MDFLKRQNWWLCLLLTFITDGLFYFALAKFMNLYDKDAWYANKWYWIFGGLCLIFPAFIMLIVFTIQINCKVAKALDVPGDSLYCSPYIWILLMIIPVVGWVLFIVMGIYISIWPIVNLYKGNGEKFIK